ncbi:uncharacterized protein Fot_05183 [Forsythia ovata]|uniref:Uncharacterized protein n=1 Tax=Forsythia ovata TaxID=205694 RepID=A0ABD1WPE5_9LAMI
MLSFSKSTPQTPPSKIASLEEIRKNLSEFHCCSTVHSPSSSTTSPPSYSESSSTSSYPTAKPVGAAAAGGVLPFKAIHQSLSQLRSTIPNRQINAGGKAIDSMLLS